MNKGLALLMNKALSRVNNGVIIEQKLALLMNKGFSTIEQKLALRHLLDAVRIGIANALELIFVL